METIKIVGEMDLYKVPEIKRDILAKISEGKNEIRLDLIDCNFVDSSGIGMIIMISQKLKESNGKLKIINKPNSLKRILELTAIWDIEE